MIVADSDVLIDALRGRQPARDRIELELGSGQLATTVIVGCPQSLALTLRTARRSHDAR